MSLSTLMRLSIILSTLVMSACTTTSVRQHQDFHEAAHSIGSVVIAPPQVIVEEIAFTGQNEKLRHHEERIIQGLTSFAQSRLKQEGLEVVDFNFEEAIKEDEDFAFSLNQAKEAYKNVLVELYDGQQVSPEDAAKFKSSLGPVVNAIADKTGAEAVLLVEFYGFEKSSGMIAKDVAVSVITGVLLGSAAVQPSEGASLSVALIDTASGDVLWANQKSAQELSDELLGVALEELPSVAWDDAPIKAVEL